MRDSHHAWRARVGIFDQFLQRSDLPKISDMTHIANAGRNRQRIFEVSNVPACRSFVSHKFHVTYGIRMLMWTLRCANLVTLF